MATDEMTLAIQSLSPADFTRDGRPSTKALSDALGRAVSATERDQAWEALEAEISGEAAPEAAQAAPEARLRIVSRERQLIIASIPESAQPNNLDIDQYRIVKDTEATSARMPQPVKRNGEYVLPREPLANGGWIHEDFVSRLADALGGLE